MTTIRTLPIRQHAVRVLADALHDALAGADYMRDDGEEHPCEHGTESSGNCDPCRRSALAAVLAAPVRELFNDAELEDYPPTVREDGDRQYVGYLEVQLDGPQSVEQADEWLQRLRDAICNPVDSGAALGRLPFDFHMHGPHGC